MNMPEDDPRRMDEIRKGLSSRSDPDKIDNDGTDSQFSTYSIASSPTLSPDAHDSLSQDSNQFTHTTDVFGTMKMVKKTSVQITKQLVQQTLIDKSLRVVKELTNQIKEDCKISVLAPVGRQIIRVVTQFNKGTRG
ncbi:uncharacterized protein TNCT_245851 [Trichonephila clavata]|uniref:Uncharacterized protein n=1 Tax=Trichonephila clavata TaxID=2740835 RepID=A0A8X6KZA4_TRICU|nr:uncharacterized protein TNCT_245851 [Trichonephila clavata]